LSVDDLQLDRQTGSSKRKRLPHAAILDLVPTVRRTESLFVGSLLEPAGNMLEQQDWRRRRPREGRHGEFPVVDLRAPKVIAA
jgi:hypothetical protein